MNFSDIVNGNNSSTNNKKKGIFSEVKGQHKGEDVDLYQVYIVKLLRTVPKNSALICKNKFTGNVYVKGSGLRFNPPWVEGKLVSLAYNVKDYPKEGFKTIDGIEITVDIALDFKVVDPMKFSFESDDVFAQLAILTKSLLREYVAGKTEEQMSRGKHSKSTIDPDSEFDDFEEKYGIHVDKVRIKNIELPQSLKDDYEKAVTAQKERERLLKEAEAKRDAARFEAEADMIREQTKIDLLAEKIGKLGDIAKDKGMDPDDVLRTTMFSQSDANVFIGMDNQDAVLKYLYGKINDNNQPPTSEPPKRK